MTEQRTSPASGVSADGIPERFVPDEMRGQLVEAEHVARYTWAAGFCSGRRVLDAGCGVGYGCELLLRAGAAEVVGIDNSAAALELARSSVSGDVRWDLGNVASLPYDDGSFEVVVCFEVIEHVDDQDQVLDELARVLRSDGLLLISSPNRDRYVPGNPHHRHEYTRAELQQALDSRFPTARIISQHVMLASVISWTGAPSFEGASTQRLSEPEPEDELYLMAMAGSDLAPDVGPVVTLGRFAEPRRWLDHIDLQKRHIDDQAHYVMVLEGRQESWRTALARLAEAEQELAELRARRAEFDEAGARLAAARGHEAELRQLRTIANSKSWRLTAPLRRLAAQIKRR
jgi:SAM-dependent methyltransferase